MAIGTAAKAPPTRSARSRVFVFGSRSSQRALPCATASSSQLPAGIGLKVVPPPKVYWRSTRPPPPGSVQNIRVAAVTPRSRCGSGICATGATVGNAEKISVGTGPAVENVPIAAVGVCRRISTEVPTICCGSLKPAIEPLLNAVGSWNGCWAGSEHSVAGTASANNALATAEAGNGTRDAEWFMGVGGKGRAKCAAPSMSAAMPPEFQVRARAGAGAQPGRARVLLHSPRASLSSTRCMVALAVPRFAMLLAAACGVVGCSSGPGLPRAVTVSEGQRTVVGLYQLGTKLQLSLQNESADRVNVTETGQPVPEPGQSVTVYSKGSADGRKVVSDVELQSLLDVFAANGMFDKSLAIAPSDARDVLSVEHGGRRWLWVRRQLGNQAAEQSFHEARAYFLQLYNSAIAYHGAGTGKPNFKEEGSRAASEAESAKSKLESAGTRRR